jgi:two-component system response regulator NreC
MSIKIFLMEDNEIVRRGLTSLLNEEPDIVVVGEASNSAEAFEKLKSAPPDVLLIDINMLAANRMECTIGIKQNNSCLQIFILAMLDHGNYHFDMLDSVADGYVLKNSSKDELIHSIRRITNHKVYTPEINLKMFRGNKPGTDEKKSPLELSKRERDVLELIADGLTNVEIAEKLCNSVRTIETRRKNLLEKTGTKNTATLIRFAVQNRLIK